MYRSHVQSQFYLWAPASLAAEVVTAERVISLAPHAAPSSPTAQV